MKIDRLLSIIMYLANHEKAKAQDLADKFEVSVRTIYRDIEAISLAGIPVTTYRGADGGIGIIDGFKLDRSIFSGYEIASIMTGLKGINSISDDIKTRLLIEKLKGLTSKLDCVPIEQEILVDLSPWNKNDRFSATMKEIKRAIRTRRVLEFVYSAGEHSTRRRVEPYVIVFKGTGWYLYAFCLLREDFRLFKLNRIGELSVTDTVFLPKKVELDRIEWKGNCHYQYSQPVELVFDKSMKTVVRDIFGDNYEITQDGKIKATAYCGHDDWFLGFLFSWGDRVEVLSPPGIRDKIKELAANILKRYE